MPHVIVEWTDNLAGEINIRDLLELIAETVRRDGEGVFPIAGLRVRGVRLSDYVVADGEENDAFIHIVVKIGKGRSPEFLNRFFDKLFERIKSHFADLMARRYLALSLYVEEGGPVGSYKHNNLHKRFKKDNAA